MSNTINQNRQLDITDYILAFLFCIIYVILCAAFSAKIMHWFIVPLLPCGILIGVDAVGWFRGKYDVFDPKGLLGLIGLHFFFTAPLLVVVWDYHTALVALTIEDHRPWIGLLAVFNSIGLILYRWVENAVSKKSYNEEKAKVWIANDSRWFGVLTVCILVAFLTQAYLIIGRGFIGKSSLDFSIAEERLAGGGIFRLIGGLGPVLLMILLTLIRSKRAVRESSIFTTYLLLAFMFVVSLLSGGLVGSRGATVWKMFWIVGIAHVFWRRFTVKQALAGLVVLILFMNVYGFFKHLGTYGLNILTTQGFTAAASESGVTARGILISDMSRADVNAYMAYVLVEKPYPYQYRWGKTILGDILVQFPRWIYYNQYNAVGASGRQRAGTDILMGSGHFDPLNAYSISRYIYGLVGQVMLNFGIYPIPLGFVLWGYCVGCYRRAMFNWKRYDMRFMFAPVMIQLLIMLLMYDFENQLYTVIFRVSIPVTIVWLISNRFPRVLVNQQEEALIQYEELTPSCDFIEESGGVASE